MREMCEDCTPWLPGWTDEDLDERMCERDHGDGCRCRCHRPQEEKEDTHE